jgi:hypothetical protein
VCIMIMLGVSQYIYSFRSTAFGRTLVVALLEKSMLNPNLERRDCGWRRHRRVDTILALIRAHYVQTMHMKSTVAEHSYEPSLRDVVQEVRGEIHQ